MKWRSSRPHSQASSVQHLQYMLLLREIMENYKIFYHYEGWVSVLDTFKVSTETTQYQVISKPLQSNELEGGCYASITTWSPKVGGWRY